MASKAILSPSASVSLRVSKASTLASDKAESSVLRTASLKVRVMFEATATPVAASRGLKVIVGATLSVIAGAEEVASTLPKASLTAAVGLTVAPLATVEPESKVTTKVELSLQLIPEAPVVP